MQKSGLGLHSMAFFGRWTGHQYDPIYRQLKVWQDFNQDGDKTQSVKLNTAAGPQTFTVQELRSLAQSASAVTHTLWRMPPGWRCARASAFISPQSIRHTTGCTTGYITPEFIAVSADSLPGRRLKQLKNIHALAVHELESTQVGRRFSDHYEPDSASRRYYAGEVAERLEKLAMNDDAWRVAA